MTTNPFQSQLDLKKWLLMSIGVILFYYSLGLVSIYLKDSANIFPIWAPSGVGVAVVLLFGFRRFAPALLLSSFFLSLHYELSATSRFLSILLSLLEAGLIGNLLNRFGEGKFRFKNYKEIFAFFFLGVVFVPLIISSLKIIILHWHMGIEAQKVQLLLDSMPGKSLGLLILTPLILSLSKWKKNLELIKLQGLEVLLLFVCLAYSMHFAFIHQKLFLLFPFIIWSALRFGYLGVNFCSLIVAIYAIYANSIGMTWTQAYIATFSLIGHMVAMVITANKKIMRTQHEMEKMLRENQRRLNFAQQVGKMGVFECNFLSSTASWTYQLESIYGFKKKEFDGSLA
jgi:integral membrane sensor domain MASE1